MVDIRPDGEYSLHRTCRTCLRNVHGQMMIPVFDSHSSHSASLEIIEELTMMKLNIARDDGLPQHICSECMGHLSAASTFRKNCEHSQDVLEKFFRNLIRNGDKQSEEDEGSDSELKAERGMLCKVEMNSEIYGHFEFLNLEEDETNEEMVFGNMTKKPLDKAYFLPNDKKHIAESYSASENEDHLNGSYCQEVDDGNASPDENDMKEKGTSVFSLECYICSKSYKRAAHLKRHLGKHSKDSETSRVKAQQKKRHFEFGCNKCGKRFAKSTNLEIHENQAECVSESPSCRFCNEHFTSIDELEDHLNDQHPPDRPHMCPVCKKTFQSVSNRNTHLQSHNKDDSYKCDVCDQGFKSKVYLSKHRKSVHTKSNHQCPHCLLKFDNTVKYEYHLKSHDPNKKYKCKFCDKSFLQHHHLANHERTHTGIRPYLCNICGKDFKQECNFKLHLRIHSGVRPYVCSVCGKDFIQRGSFVMHMRQHSGVRPYQCEHCGKDFVQKSSLTVHLRTHTGERPYKCDSCDKAFAQAQQLKYHRHSAHGGPAINKKEPPPKPSSDGRVYPYCCPLCNKGFKLPSSLSSHMKIHNEERKHVCTQCGNSFKRAEHLRIHINGVHLKQKPYACDLCNKTFAQSGDRNIHMRRHTGEKPHQCPYCKKYFRLLKAMRAHVRIHTGEKPYTCEYCKMDFMTYTSLATHTMKHQNENRKSLALSCVETAVVVAAPEVDTENAENDGEIKSAESELTATAAIITLTVPTGLSSIIVSSPV